jgi:ClpP class serine protease
LNDEERQLFMRDVNIMYENFMKAVSRNRNIEIEKIKELADGSSITGQVALEKGLVDRIGDVYSAKKYLENEVLGEEAELCW